MTEGIRSEKVSPAMRTLVDYITGSHGATTGEAIMRNYAKLNEKERESYKSILRERYVALTKVIDSNTDNKESALAEYINARSTAGFIADQIGLDISDIRQ